MAIGKKPPAPPEGPPRGPPGDPPRDPPRPPRQPPGVRINRADFSPEGCRLTIDVTNPNDRAIYVIGQARVILYDPGTRRLRVQLSDTGRHVAPGLVSVLPTMRTIDPSGQAELTVDLPPTIVKLAPTPPGGELTLEEQAIHEATEVELVVAWAATPFYRDTRPGRGHDESEFVAWQDGEVTATAPVGGGPRPRR